MKTAEKIASSIGKGLVAGFAGTAAMTVSSTLEARLRGRAPSTAPARATAEGARDRVVRGCRSAGEVQRPIPLGLRHRLGHLPWTAGRRRPSAAKGDSSARAAVGSAQVTLPALDIAPPSVFWAKEEIAIDALHHTVYAVATGIAYELLSSRTGAG